MSKNNYNTRRNHILKKKQSRLDEDYKFKIRHFLAKSDHRAEIETKVQNHLEFKLRVVNEQSLSTFWPEIYRFVISTDIPPPTIDVPKKLTSFKEFDPFEDNDLTYLLDEIL